MPRRLSPLVALASLVLAPVRATAGAAPRSGPLRPAAPPPAALESPAPVVEPAAPRVSFLPKLPPKEAPEPPGAPPPQPEEGPGAPGERRAAEEDSWLDASHAFLAERMLAPVIVFDRFFSDETELEAERSRSYVRWRNELLLRPGHAARYAVGLRADLRLPGMSRVLDRLRFVVEGQTRDALSALLPSDGEDTEAIGSGGAELRLRVWDGILAHGDLGAGFLLQLPPGGFARARLRWAIPVGPLFLTRIATSGFWRTDTHFGTSVDAHLERGIRRYALLRLSGFSQLTQRSNGVEWSGELAALRAFTPTVAASIGVGLEGTTQSHPPIDRYRASTRFRTDVYRRWLFVELEPEVSWPWNPDRGGRDTEYAVTLRLEVQFRGFDAPPKRAKRHTVEPPEPAEADEADEPPSEVGIPGARVAG